jgi:histidinol-phosphate aminotransferase
VLNSVVPGLSTGAVRLDYNESPLGPPPAAIARLQAHATDLHRYPRGLLEEVRAGIAARHGLPPDSLLLTNGVDEAIDLTLTLTDKAWFVSPGFDGYGDRAETAHRPGTTIPLDDRWEPVTPPEKLTAGGCLFLAQPHNPTGNMFSPDWVRGAVDSAALTFLDLTYAGFAVDPGALSALAGRRSVLTFQSFSKAYGLAGIRLGVLSGHPEVIDAMRRRQRFHSVDAVALHAAAGALEDDDYQAQLRRYICAMRPRYAAALSAHPVIHSVRDTQANFVLARCHRLWTTAEVADRLAAEGVWIRDCGSLGLPGWLRISIGTSEDLNRLHSGLDAVRSTAEGKL